MLNNSLRPLAAGDPPSDYIAALIELVTVCFLGEALELDYMSESVFMADLLAVRVISLFISSGDAIADNFYFFYNIRNYTFFFSCIL